MGCPLPLFPPPGQASQDSISLLAGVSVATLTQGFCMREQCQEKQLVLCKHLLAGEI